VLNSVTSVASCSSPLPRTRFFALFLALIAASGFANARDREREVSVPDGHKYQYLESGKHGQVVVFESGLGDGLQTWAHVWPGVSRFAHAFVYSRSGYGSSESRPGMRSAEIAVEELREVLRARNLKPPYVLVGHSLGGLYMQYYARNYPNEVAGLVLVDSTHWSQVPRSRTAPRLAGVPGVLTCSMTPTACAEFDGIELSGQQVHESAPLQEMPFVVISAGARAEQVRPAPKLITVPVNDEIDAMQRDLARQLPDGKQVMAYRSGHYIQNTEPELIVDAVRDMTAGLSHR